MSEAERPPREAHRFPAERRHVLKDEERRRWLPPEPILAAARIASGETVIDVGAGTGFWTAPLAELVGPSGRIVATDVEPVMVDELRALIQHQGTRHVEIIQSAELSIPLPDGIADAAVLGFVLHEPSDPPAFLHEITRLLKPAGRVLVVDWHKRSTGQGPPLEHRLSEEEAREMLKSAGYSLQSVDAPNEDVYVLLARRT